MTPSTPRSCPNGSSKSVKRFNREMSPEAMFARSQMIAPAGAATITALPRTKMVLSKIERIITLPILGFLYGGSSSIKDDGMPFKTVAERSFDMIRETAILSIMKAARINPAAAVLAAELLFKAAFPEIPAVKKIKIKAIRVGNFPLQGMKLLVIIAIRRSLGDSIIRQPITPHALHPSPIHMVRDCLPCAPHFLKLLSRLKAILGKYPKSSKSVNRGKNMAIGGSITDTTQLRVLYIPSMTKDSTFGGKEMLPMKLRILSSMRAKKEESAIEG